MESNRDLLSFFACKCIKTIKEMTDKEITGHKKQVDSVFLITKFLKTFYKFLNIKIY